MSQQWARLTTVYSGLAVDTIRATLELEGIPVLVRGYQSGNVRKRFPGTNQRGRGNPRA